MTYMITAKNLNDKANTRAQAARVLASYFGEPVDFRLPRLGRQTLIVPPISRAAHGIHTVTISAPTAYDQINETACHRAQATNTQITDEKKQFYPASAPSTIDQLSSIEPIPAIGDESLAEIAGTPGGYMVPDEHPKVRRGKPMTPTQPEKAVGESGCLATVTKNEEKNGVEIRFSSIPPEETRDHLKAHGFRWSKFGKCWYAKQSAEAVAVAERIKEAYDTQAAGETKPAAEVQEVNTAEEHRGEEMTSAQVVTEPNRGDEIPPSVDSEKLPEVILVETEKDDDPGEIIKAVDIKAMVKERDNRLEKHLQAFHFLHDHKINLDYLAHANTRSGYITNEKNVDDIRKRIDRDYWKQLHEKSGLASYMSAKRREELSRQFHTDQNIPEFTPDNINTTFAELIKNAPGEYEEAVCSVFSSLSWDYKTNNPVLFGARIIETYTVQKSYGGRPTASYNDRWDKINDLVRVMRLMDKKPVHEYRAEIRSAAVDSMNWSEWSEFPEHYLDLKPYKNGNLHLRFRRPDLVARMNKIIAERYPHALPASQA